MMRMHRYVVAVKREKWDSVTLRDAFGRVADIPDVNIIGDLDGPRTVIEASKVSARRLEEKLNDCCYVEPEIAFTPQGTTHP